LYDRCEPRHATSAIAFAPSQRSPNIRIEALQIDANTGTSLQTGKADLALGLIPALEAGFFQQTLYSQDWVCIANPRHNRVKKTLSLSAYQSEAHVSVVSGTGYTLLEGALNKHKINRRVLLELPGFLGLAAIILTTDLIATLPRHTGETLARANGLRVLACPMPIPSFTVKQHWHECYHHDPANQWLRNTCANLFQRKVGKERCAGAVPSGVKRSRLRRVSR
jgi:DNA-binding transcriptional LysR family regulator